MKKYLKHIIFCLSCVGGSIFSQTVTPNVVSAQGGFNTSTAGSISWTLGEISTETYSITSNYITQGFQQPKLSIASLVPTIDLHSEIAVYPNPVSSNLIVNFRNPGLEKANVEIFDVQGKKLLSEKLNNTVNMETNYSFENYQAGIYLLTISNESGSKKISYKITKAN